MFKDITSNIKNPLLQKIANKMQKDAEKVNSTSDDLLNEPEGNEEHKEVHKHPSKAKHKMDGNEEHKEVHKHPSKAKHK